MARVRLLAPFLSWAALATAGCAALENPARVAREPGWTEPQPFEAARRPVALVLSSGSARGFAHVGVLRVLEENGIRPDIIVGSSIGSVVGALYASGLDAVQLDAAMASIDTSLLTDLVWPRFGVLPGQLGFISGEKLRRFVASHLRHSLIEDFPIRFAAVATDVGSGGSKAFNAGDAALAVKASTAIPGLVAPVPIAGRSYADGQVANPMPVRVARELGAHTVIAVDVIYPPGDAILTNPLRVTFQAFVISTYRLREEQLREADLVISPAIEPTSGQYGAGARAHLIEAGERAAREALPRILEAIGRK